MICSVVFSLVYKENHRLCLWDKKDYAYAEKKKETDGYRKNGTGRKMKCARTRRVMKGKSCCQFSIGSRA